MNRTAALSPAFSGAIGANLFEDGLPYEQQTDSEVPPKSQEIVTAVLTAGGHGEGARRWGMVVEVAGTPCPGD